MQLFSIFAKIGLDTTEFERGMGKSEERGKSFGASIAAMGAAVAAAGAAVGALGAAAMRVGGEFQSGMNTISARTGMAAADAEQLGMAFRDMALDGQFSARELSQAFGSIAVYGQDAAHGIEIMEYSMVLAQAVGTDLSGAAYFLGNYLQKVGRDSSYAEKYINLFASASQRTGIGLDSLQDYLFRANASLNMAGISGTEATAVFGALYQAGVRGANAYSGFSQAIQSLLLPTDNQSAALAQLGISTVDAAGNQRDMMEVFFELGDALENVTDSTRRMDLQTTLFTQSTAQAFADELFTQRHNLREMIPQLEHASQATGGMGVAFEMAGVAGGGLGNQLGVLRAAGEDMLKTIFGVIEAPLAQAFGLAGEKAREFALRLREGGDLHPMIQRMGEAIAQLVSTVMSLANALLPIALTILPPVIAAITTLADWVIRLHPAIIAVVSAIYAFKAALGVKAAITALAAAITAFKAGFAGAAAATGASTAALKAHTLGVAANTAAIKLQTIAQKALNAVKMLNPIGAAIALTAALVAGITALVRWRGRETDATRLLREQTERLNNATQDLTDTQRESADAHEERLRTMETESATASELLGKIADLTAAESLSADERARLLIYTNMLGEAIPELAEAYDAETGAMMFTIDEIERLIDARQAHAEAAELEARNLEIIQQRIETEALLYETMDERLALEYRLANGDFHARELGAARAAVSELVALEEELRDSRAASVDEFERNMEQMTYILEQNADDIADWASLVETGMTTAGYALQQYGQMSQAALDALYEAQQDVLEDLGRIYTNIAGAATNMFRAMNNEADLSLRDMQNNLDHNQGVVEQWSADVEALAAQGLYPGFVAAISAMGVDSAAQIRVMAAAIENDPAGLQRLSETFAQGGRVALGALQDAFGLDIEVARAAANTAASAGMALQRAMDDVGFDNLGAQVAEDFARGIRERMILAHHASMEMAGLVEAAIRETTRMYSPSRIMLALGGNIGESFADGIMDASGDVSDAAHTIAQTATDTAAMLAQPEGSEAAAISNPVAKAAERINHILEETITHTADAVREIKNKLQRMLADINRMFLAGGRAIGADFFRALGDGLISQQAALLHSAANTANAIRATFAASPAGFGAAPRFSTGLARVPYDDFPALLHKNEMVLTAKQADAYRHSTNEHGAQVVVHQYFYGVKQERTAFELYRAARLAFSEAMA